MKKHAYSCLARSVRVGLSFVALGLAADRSQAQPSSVPLAHFWRTDGPVLAAAVQSNTLYLAGQFSYIGPGTGGAGVVNDTTAAAKPGFPVVNGSVYASAADGNGGWYIGGNFSSVGGIVRSNLAHILADNTVDMAWNPALNGSNLVIVVSGSNIYIGGSFTRVGAATRNRIAAFDAATGELTTWNPNASSGAVSAITPAGNLLYVGGSFTSIGGQTRNRIAALDVSTGLATTWNPGASPGSVNAVAVSGTTVYIGGSFTTAGGKPRSRIAALDRGSDAAMPWLPEADGMVNALAVSGGTVFAAGQFSSIGSSLRTSLAALDAITGLATDWNPAPNANVNALVVVGTHVLVGGAFRSIGSEKRMLLASIDASTGDLNSWNPGLSGLVAGTASQVFTIAPGNGEVLAGGNFASMGGLTRSNLAALDVTTGRATVWDPSAGGPVNALAIGSNSVFVGGTFTNLGGATRRRLAAVDPVTGTVQTFDPNVLGRTGVGVFSLQGDGAGGLYVGGNFTNIASNARNSIAAFAGGHLTPWDPNAQATLATASASVNVLLLSGNTLYAGGDYVRIGGQDRLRIAALDTATGAATSWNPAASNTVNVLALSGTNLYVGGSFTNIGGQIRSRIAALSTVTGAATTWNPNVGVSSPQVRAIALAGKSVYVGGQFTQVGGEFRNCAAGLNAGTALANTWNPDVDGAVRVLLRTLDALYVGGEFTTVGGQRVTYFAAFPAVTFFVPGSLRMANGVLSGSITAADGNRLTVQGTTDFAAWAEVGVYQPAGFPINFTDPDAGAFPLRYYRAILETE